MSRELLDKILEGDFSGANTVYGSEMAEKALAWINVHESLTHGDFSILEDEDIKELLDDILFHIQESISENPEYTKDDICDEWIENIIVESFIRGFLDDTIVLNEYDEFELKENVVNAVESKIIQSVLNELKFVKRVRSRNKRKPIRTVRRCPPNKRKQGNKCVRPSREQKKSVYKKTATGEFGRTARRVAQNKGKQNQKNRLQKKSMKVRKNLGIK